MARNWNLTFICAPGDTLVQTAFVRDLRLHLPEGRIFLTTAHPEIWAHNPHARIGGGLSQAYTDVRAVKLAYGAGIHAQKEETVHFLSWFYRDFAEKTGIEVPMTLPRGDVHFGPDEQAPLVGGRYWVVVAGGKSDFPVKVWETSKFQRVVDVLREAGISVVQLGATHPGHRHPQLDGVLDLTGRTSLRDTMRIVRDADGVLCGVTYMMHLAAALERPCVVIAGGREAPWWEAYVRENAGLMGTSSLIAVPHRFLHTVGLLDCCQHHGCWKRHVKGQESLCRRIIETRDGLKPECTTMITPEHAVEAIMSYYEDKTIPPIGEPKPIPESVASAPRIAPVHLPAPPPVLVGTPAGQTIVAKDAATRKHDVYPMAVTTAVAEEPPAAAIGPVAMSDWAALHNPHVGGKFTVFMLMYGDFPELHRRALESLLATTPRWGTDIRIGSNELCDASVRMVDDLVAQGVVRKHYRNRENIRKYPAMHAMFNDPSLPIATKYVVWLDDDTVCDKSQGWLGMLAELIGREHPNGGRLYGPVRYFELRDGQVAWVKAAPWFRGMPFRARTGKPAPNIRTVKFASGSLWALCAETIRAQGIPDARLGHNGGDYMIGEQVNQAGGLVVPFCNNKEHVTWSSAKRRGLSEVHPGVRG